MSNPVTAGLNLKSFIVVLKFCTGISLSRTLLLSACSLFIPNEPFLMFIAEQSIDQGVLDELVSPCSEDLIPGVLLPDEL